MITIPPTTAPLQAKKQGKPGTTRRRGATPIERCLLKKKKKTVASKSKYMTKYN